jgi:hypothetical protein
MREVSAFRLTIAVALLGASTGARADLTPNGNPNHLEQQDPKYGTAKSSLGFIVNLNPNPAVFEPQGNCPWLLPALNSKTATYNTDPFNVWKFNFAAAPLQGGFLLEDYEAWADNKPAVANLGTTQFPARSYPLEDNFGGTAFEIFYKPSTAEGSTDPKPADVHWIQVIYTNHASLFSEAGANAVPAPGGGGFEVFMDNGNADNPYYGNLTNFKTANGAGLVDRPFVTMTTVPDMVFQAQAFLTTESDSFDAFNGITTHTVTIYDGVYWGYQVVPEPASLVMVGIGGLLLASRRASRLRLKISA